MRRVVEICTSNLELGVQQVVDALRIEFPEIEFREWGCLGNCHRCFRVPFILLDETVLIEAEDPDTLLMRAREALSRG